MRIEYTLSEKNFLEAQRSHGGWSTRLLPFFGGLLILAGISGVLQNPKHVGSAPGGIVIGAALMFSRRLLLSHSYRTDKRLHGPLAATFSDEGVEVESSTGASKNSWIGFTQFVETRNLFVLYQGPACLQVFPKSCLGPEEVNAIRSLVQQKMGKEVNVDSKSLSPRAWIFVVIVGVAFALMVITIRNTLRHSAPSSAPAQTPSTN